MVNTKNMDLGRPVDKLSQRWEGPFQVVKCSSHAVTLRLPANMKISPTFHVSMVRHRPAEKFAGQEDSDLSMNKGRVIVRTDGHDDVVEWEFERILDYGKADNGRWQYRVQWRGHPPSWQPAGDLRGCDDAIWSFHDAHPELPGPPSWVRRRRQ